jgi:hypothetical protein
MEGDAQPRIAGLGDALLVVDLAALPRSRRQTGIGRKLTSIIVMAEQALRPEDGRELGADAGALAWTCSRASGASRSASTALSCSSSSSRRSSSREICAFKCAGSSRPSPVRSAASRARRSRRSGSYLLIPCASSSPLIRLLGGLAQ